MPCLEYRLLDEINHFPVLYIHQDISQEEIALRFTCDYFIKKQLVYEKTSCAIDNGIYVIYVKPNYEEYVPLDMSKQSLLPDINIEVRHYHENSDHHLVVHQYSFTQPVDALLHLTSNYLYIAEQEWEKTSTEIDEDRQVYVIYAHPAGQEADT